MTTSSRTGRFDTLGTAIVVAVMTLVAGLIVPASAASAASLSPTLSATPAAGNPTVTFTGSASGALPVDSYVICFGDEKVLPCDAKSGTSTSAAALGAGVSHTYAAAGTFAPTLFVVEVGVSYASPPLTLAVTIDPVAALKVSSVGLTGTLDGTASTALAGDTWWACFGESATCSQAKPDVTGTVTVTAAALPATPHTYAKAGTYPATLTIQGPFRSSTASQLVIVASDPTAVLTSNVTTGAGPLDVTFDGSKSTAGSADAWALCYGDNRTCSQTTPDANGLAPIALPTTPHTYPAGNYTATLWVTGGGQTSSATLAIAVSSAAAAPDGSCALSGLVRSCELFAKSTGQVTVATASIPFWGFTASQSATPVLGGPRLIATEGETLTFTVHNELPSQAGPVSITVPGLEGAPDLVGVGAGATAASGRFTLTKPGTFLYEAGLTSGGERQVAMGLAGVLIVRPGVTNAANAAHCAYDAAVAANPDCGHDPLNFFDREKIVAVNELDPDFNRDPFGHDTVEYHPTYFFVDGVAYDPAKLALDPASGFDPGKNNVRFDAAPGDTVLVRYANLGLREHSLNLVNLLQTETGRDGNQVRATTKQSTEFLNAGQSGDAFIVIPPDAKTGTNYPLYDAGLHLNNGVNGGLGGMLSYFNVVNGAQAANIGPVGTEASAAPVFDPSLTSTDNSQIPPLPVTATFVAQQATSGTTPTVASVRWALDAVPTIDAQWQPSGANPSPAGATAAAVTFTIPAATLTSLLATEPDAVYGDHIIWLQAVDSSHNPGPAVGAAFSLAMRDPVISGMSISPRVTDGSTNSALLPVASTKASRLSNHRLINGSATTLNVDSTAGFPGTCAGPCQITVGITVADGPAQDQVAYQVFDYTSLTANSFLGVVLPPGSTVANDVYEFRTGNTVALDVVPAGFVGVNATATASIPGWVVAASQACVVVASGPVPGPADRVEAGCTGAPATNTNLFDLNVANRAPLASVNGFFPPPPLPNGATNAANFWVLLRAQEGPDASFCYTPGRCRWSPWLYYNPVTATVTQPHDLAQDNVSVTSTAGFPARGQLSSTTTSDQPVTFNYIGINPQTFLTDNGGTPSGTLATGSIVTGSAGAMSTFETLKVVRTGPTTSKVTVSPNPNNGFQAAAGNLGLFDSFNVHATVSSRWANIALAEAFVAPTSRPRGTTAPQIASCAVAPNTPAGCVTYGQGAEMTTATGLWGNAASVDVTAFIPLSELQGKPDGLIRIWVHGQDLAGNWGPFEAVDLVLDRTNPVLDSATGSAPVAVTTVRLAGPAAGTLAVASTTGFPVAPAKIVVITSRGSQSLSYTGMSATTFTGVTGGTAGSTVAPGAQVSVSGGTALVTAHDVPTNGVAAGVTQAEWFVGNDPGAGNATKAVTTPAALPVTTDTATPVTFTISGLPGGPSVQVRVMDAAGNWSAPVAVP